MCRKKYKMKAYSIPQKALRRPLRDVHKILLDTEKVFIKHFLHFSRFLGLQYMRENE